MRVVLAYQEAINRRDLRGLAACVAENCLLETAQPAPGGEALQGKAAILAYWQNLFESTPPTRLQVEEIFNLGERCIMRWRLTSQVGEQNPGELRGVSVFRVRDGLICEQFDYSKG